MDHMNTWELLADRIAQIDQPQLPIYHHFCYWAWRRVLRLAR